MSDMSEWENKIYEWRKGYDDDDMNILKHLNNIINSIYELEGYGWDCIYNRMNVMLEYQERTDDILADLKPVDVAVQFEAIRALLFGGKINYDFLEKVLTENLHKYGYVRPKGESNEKV